MIKNNKLFLLSMLFAFSCIIISCGDSGSSSVDADKAVGDSDSANVIDTAVANDSDSQAVAGTAVGSFLIKLVATVPATETTQETPGYTSILGKVYNGPYPSLTIWELSLKDGDCTLYTPRIPFCNTPCGGNAACVEDDVCQDYPASVGVGNITVKGVRTNTGTTEFVLKPVANNYQKTDLPYPAFDEGGAISVIAEGGSASAFTINSNGVAPFELLNESFPVEKDKPLSLSWTAAGKAGISSIHVKLDISHHGGAKGMILCDTDDDGSMDLSSALITKLIDLGVAGFPTIIVTRQSIGSTTIAAGRVDLEVYSEVEKEVLIPGLVSCNDPEDCPEGQTCKDNLTCG